MGKVPPTDATAGLAARGVIGHGAVIDLLARSLERGRVAHAYLFSGPEHVGKMTVARAFAGSLLGDDAVLDRHPDFVAIERAEDQKTGTLRAGIVIDQVRDLRTRLSMGAFMNGWKAAIINDAHLMNVEAANALLKSLEEPHERTLLILIASSDEAVLPTIRSRCQVLRFGRVATDRIAGALEERGVPAENAGLYARLADGRPGRAFAFAEDPTSLSDMNELRAAVLDILGAPLADRVVSAERLVPPKLPFAEAGARATAALDLLAEVLRDALLDAAGHADGAVHVDVGERVADLAGRFGGERLVAALETVEYARRLIRENVNPRAALEHVALAL